MIDGREGGGLRHDDRVRVTACRGCCCGNADKHPDTDHAGQLDRLRAMVVRRPGRVEVQTSTCLGPCAQANVVVVRPSPRARRAGARAVWLALVRDPGILEVLDGWIAGGGPGVAPIPPLLELHVISAPRPARH